MSEEVLNQDSVVTDLTLKAFYRENGLGFGGGDILCIGGGSIVARAEQLILLFLSFYDEQKKNHH